MWLFPHDILSYILFTVVCRFSHQMIITVYWVEDFQLRERFQQQTAFLHKSPVFWCIKESLLSCIRP